MSKFDAFTGSYALNALDEAQLAGIEAHLASCRICQDQVAESGRPQPSSRGSVWRSHPPTCAPGSIETIGTTRQAQFR